MYKISMIVWNEFLTDARVLKEANTLLANGYQVTVHAIHSPGKTIQKEKLSNGLQIVRVSRDPLRKVRNGYFNKLLKRVFRFFKRVKNFIVRKMSGNDSKQKVESSKETQRVKANSNPSKKSLLYKLILRGLTHLGLCYALIKSKPNAVHSHDVNTLVIAWIASKVLRVPLVYDAHEISTSREGYKSIRKYVGWIEKKLMPRAAATITTTEMRAKFFARAYGVSRPVVLQNRPTIYPLKKSNRIREELGLEESWPIAVYQGGLQAGRGLDRLVKIASSIKQIYLVLIGGGKLETELKDLVSSLGVAEQVKFIPIVPLAKLPEYTSSANIGIQPIINSCLNHYSTDSNKLFEYVLAGLPVIATDFPEIRKVVNEYKVGILVDESNKSLNDAVNRLVQNKSYRDVLTENAIKARDQLSWESQEEKLISLYTELRNK